jgi:hypothetical protein
VPHRELLKRSAADYAAKAARGAVFVDVKSRLNLPSLQREGFSVWRL